MWQQILILINSVRQNEVKICKKKGQNHFIYFTFVVFCCFLEAFIITILKAFNLAVKSNFLSLIFYKTVENDFVITSTNSGMLNHDLMISMKFVWIITETF